MTGDLAMCMQYLTAHTHICRGVFIIVRVFEKRALNEHPQYFFHIHANHIRKTNSHFLMDIANEQNLSVQWQCKSFSNWNHYHRFSFLVAIFAETDTCFTKLKWASGLVHIEFTLSIAHAHLRSISYKSLNASTSTVWKRKREAKSLIDMRAINSALQFASRPQWLRRI